MATRRDAAAMNGDVPNKRRSHIGWSYPLLMGLILALSAVELALSALLTAKYSAHHNFISQSERSRVHYILFAAIWTFLIGSIYFWLFVLAVAGIFTSILSHSLFLFLTWAIWLIAASLITSSLGRALSCSLNVVAYCQRLRALTGISWAIFALLTLLLLHVLRRGRKRSSGNGYGYRGPLHENQTV